MSEAANKQGPSALIVASVDPGSPAERAGLQPGDLVLQVNGRAVLDILDYRFHAADARPQVTYERDGERRSTRLRTAEGEDAGLNFTQDLADRIHTCHNKCVFCFIHQMPKRMRRSLYLMDDDFRLSFMHGNYITLTNMSEEEFARVIEQRLSPLYVSVHATDPDLRGRLLGKKQPEPVLPRLRQLAESRIDVHAQIVLCPGLNDGEALDQTLEELAAEHPACSGRRAGVLSVAIVPVGLTQFRERLPQLQAADRDYAAEMLDAIAERERTFQKSLGTRFVWLSDEWYFLAERPFPGAAYYEDFPQLEDGIGTVRLFLDDARAVSRSLPERAPTPVSATLVTAELASSVVQGYADRLNRIEDVDVNVCVVKNRFFGGGINIAGLLTAQDIAQQVGEFADARSVVYVPSICLRDGQLFLDDWTMDDLRRETGRDFRVSGTKPRELAAALGLARPPRSRSGMMAGWVMEDGTET